MANSPVSSLHGIADAIELRQTIMTLRAEIMMEEVLALLCRSAIEKADTVGHPRRQAF